jgi:hypothetical protein
MRRRPLGSPDIGILAHSPLDLADIGFESAAGFATAGGSHLNEPGVESVERVVRIFKEPLLKKADGLFKKPMAVKTPAIRGSRQKFSDFKLPNTPSGFVNAGKQLALDDFKSPSSFTDFKLPSTPAFDGFATAGGSALKNPSEVSMRRASNMFADEDILPAPPDTPVRLEKVSALSTKKTGKRRSFISPLAKGGGARKSIVVNRRQSLLSSRVVVEAKPELHGLVCLLITSCRETARKV